MKNVARDELRFLVGKITSALTNGITTSDNALAADLHRALGVFQASSLQFGEATIGDAIGEAFDAAFLAAVPIEVFSSLRDDCEAFAPTTFQGVVLKQAAIVFCLIEEARCVAAADMLTRSDAQTLLVSIGAAFDRAEEFASDIGDTGTYTALVSLHAAFTRDLVIRSSSLPEIIQYELPESTTSLALANRLYGDASRAEELERSNLVVHPAFMPSRGTALTR